MRVYGAEPFSNVSLLTCDQRVPEGDCRPSATGVENMGQRWRGSIPELKGACSLPEGPRRTAPALPPSSEMVPPAQPPISSALSQLF